MCSGGFVAIRGRRREFVWLVGWFEVSGAVRLGIGPELETYIPRSC